MSSREKPSAVCVRSLVPNEKNSACCAISPAAKQARGSSIIVPTLEPRGSNPSSAATRVDEVAGQLQLAGVGDERDHDLDDAARRRCGRATARAARKIARACIS